MTAQVNSDSQSTDSLRPIGADSRQAGDQYAAQRRVRGWVLAGLLAVVAVLGLAPGARAQDTIHVTPDGSGDGSSWASPTSLRNALSAATSGDEIWVATGVYTPGLTVASTFTVTSGVQLYGGFAATETLRTQRDWVANPTILSGDIGGDDVKDGNGIVTTTASIMGTNAYHVLWLDGVNGAPITTTTRIDGFVVTAGSASGTNPHNYGGGLYCAGSGSGKACSPTIANVTFSGNTASRGGAMSNFGSTTGVSSPSLNNVTFSNNSAAVSGGAMYNYGATGVSSPSLLNVIFSGNSAGSTGGAMYNYGGGGVSSPSLINVTFSNNSASYGAGAMHNYGNSGVSSPRLFNVTFIGNSVTDGGGGGAMNNDGNSGGICRPSLVNVVLWGNTATNGGQLYNVNAAPIISYTLTPSTTAAIYNFNSTITWGVGNITDTAALTTADIFVDATNGDLSPAAFSPAIDSGDNSAVPAEITTDVAGNPRFHDDRVMRDRGSGSPPLVDMGAYERQTDSCPSATPIYVDAGANGGRNNGSSWANAFTDLQTALTATRLCPGLGEIWVARGVYTPGVTAAIAFTVTSGMQLYGGFAATETLRAERDWVANPTIFSGDIGGDDSTVGGVVTTTASIVGDNAYHVLWLGGVSGDPITATTRIDGFTITAGKASGTDSHNSGGGLYCAGNGSGNECSPTIANVNFSGNAASFRGGAMYDNGSTSGVSNPVLVNVTFSGNRASNGGAVYNDAFSSGRSSPSLLNVVFQDNAAAGGNGGAMCNDGYQGVSSPSLTNVVFARNRADVRAGALYNSADEGVSSPNLVNVTFSGNTANFGGAMYNGSWSGGASHPILVNVVMFGNTANVNGAALYNVESTPAISYTLVPSTTAAIYCNTCAIAWGSGNITDTSAYTTTDLFVDAANGDLRLAANSPAVDVGDNSAIPAGVTTDLNGDPRIVSGVVDLGAYERQQAHISLAKAVSPTAEVAYLGVVTYTLLLGNSGAADPTVLLTDTLPAPASFAYWIAQSGATVAGDTVQWSGALGSGAVVTVTFAITNTASGGAAITNTAYLSGSASILDSAAVYTVTANSYPSGSGLWSQVFAPCASTCKRVIPAGVTITLDQDINLDGDFEIEPGGAIVANGKTVTLTGDQPQTLTGNPLTFYNLVINKSNKTDTVSIDGKLKVSKKLTVRKGKLVSASDYGDIELEVDGELQLTNDITVSGHFTNAGTLDTNGFGVIFDGAQEQRLVLDTFTSFDALTVYTGTTLVEAVTDDNALVATLTNYGTIRKRQPVDGVGSYYFGLAGNYPASAGMVISVTDLTGGDPLTAIQVDRIDANHPNAPVGSTTDIYWTITPAGTNYVATVVLPQNALADPLACRYSAGAWNCTRSSFDSVADLTVTRAGVSAFSDWAVFNAIATTTTLTTSANPAPVFSQVTFTATVAPATATGSVEFFADGASLGTAAIAAGKVQMATGGLSVGTHIITATLIPTGPYLASSGTLAGSQVIDKAATTVALLSSLNPAPYSQAVTVTANVAMSGVTTAERQTGPTGQVRFSDESGELATVELANGVAAFSRDTWAVGTHTVTVEYLGDTLFAGSSSSPLAQVVGKHGTATSLATTPNPAQAGATIVMTATVEKQVSILKQLQPADPSGQVQFRVEGGNVLGTFNLVGNTAVFTKNDFARGVYTIVAEYLGDASYSGSTSAGVQQVVSPPLTARNDAAGTLQGEAVQIDPLANDSDPAGGGLVVAAVTQPASGSVAIDGGAKTVTFTPDPAGTGLVTFTYTARDSSGITDEAVVAVVVTAVDETGDAPQVGVVDNEAGSTHDFDSGRFQTQVQVPAGSYPAPLGDKEIFYLAYTQVITPTGDVTQPPETFTWVGMVFHLAFFVNGTGLGHYEFPQPLTLVIAYDPALLGGLSEQLLTPFYWNGTAWVNDGMSITHIDTTAHQITIQVWHLSEFAFFARPPLNTPSYLFLPAVVNGSNLAPVQEAADGAPAATKPAATPVEAVTDGPAAEATPEAQAPDVATPETEATPPAPAEEDVESGAPADEPAADPTMAPDATPDAPAADTVRDAEPTPDEMDAAPSLQLHLPLIAR